MSRVSAIKLFSKFSVFWKETHTENVYNYKFTSKFSNFPNGKCKNKFNKNIIILLKYFFASLALPKGKAVFKFCSNKVLVQVCFLEQSIFSNFPIFFIYKKNLLSVRRDLEEDENKPENNIIFSVFNSYNRLGSTSCHFQLPWLDVQSNGFPKGKLLPSAPALKPDLHQSNSFLSKNSNNLDTLTRFKYLGSVLSKYFFKDVELELISLCYPYYDSNILAQLIGLNSNKYNFTKILALLFNLAYVMSSFQSRLKTGAGKGFPEGNPGKIVGFSSVSDKTNISLRSPFVPQNLLLAGEGEPKAKAKTTSPISQIIGIKLKIAGFPGGKLISQGNGNSTVKLAYKGSFKNESLKGPNPNNYLESASYTTKNKIGVYTVSVIIGHMFVN